MFCEGVCSCVRIVCVFAVVALYASHSVCITLCMHHTARCERALCFASACA
eukprot:JP448655.1.p2 GENE.JP448655.1~~JP448655.1.p2  ORF type:complete len:51 (-),score=3.05 JP448655.1:162-314(-)